MHDVAEFLKGHDPFSGLDEERLQRLAERVEIEFFAARTIIFKQGGRPQNEVRVVRRGAVELVDRGRVVDLLGEGELFGHPSMLSGLLTGFEARAHEDSLCYALAAQDVIPLLARPASLPYLARSLLKRREPITADDADADAAGAEVAQQPALRLDHQVNQLEQGIEPDEHLDPRQLNSLTRRYLRDGFREVAAVQRTLAAELRWAT